MFRHSRVRPLAACLLLALPVFWLVAADKTVPQSQRQGLLMAHKNGNYRDAYNGLRQLALDPTTDRLQVGQDLTVAIDCLRRLGRADEIDDFREAVIAAHPKNWRLLETAARSYADGEHFGFIVAGKFYRGQHRGGGRYVGTFERDRTRALQLMQRALDVTRDQTDKPALAAFHLRFATMLLSVGGQQDAWRLQYLTDLGQLPDYQEGYYWPGGSTRGAPVDANGDPVFHHLPKSYAAAKTDGERWRWVLTQAVEFGPSLANEVDVQFANFLRGQFGVQTMAVFGLPNRTEEDGKEKTGTFALQTLGDDETIARLANGLKRFQLPDEFNWIKVYERVAGRGRTTWGEQARDAVADEHENRRQYARAAADWKKAIADYGPGTNNVRQHRLDQIVGNWGRFEPGEPQPAGREATVDFRFRNGDRVSFEAWEINVPKLLADVRAYLRGHTGQLDWNQLNVGNIGFRLVEQQQRQYLGARVAAWDLKLRPRPEHVDDRITVHTPLKKPGAYLLTARLANGNVSRVIVWVSDTVLVKKQLEGQAFYYVADAVSGQPMADATVDFFGWQQVQTVPNQNAWHVNTTAFTVKTNGDGQVLVGQGQMPPNYQWLIVARKPSESGADRFAYLGFTGVWFGRVYDPEYNQTKAFVITDRPVYRPEQKVQFKAWVRHAKYDQPDTSSFAGRSFVVRIHNPKGEKVLEKDFTADEYGGFSGEFPLSKGTTLGQYHLQVLNAGMAVASFRVEEYKKPEFEVEVEAPREPVRLGEKITATIKAKYYFGAPVTHAKVKYKVLRSSHSSRWYPRGDWDWFYGSGYWWFAGDYAWYPGWREWGTLRPLPIWWPQRWEQPEVVLENEVEIGPDGTVPVVIDTRPAQELHGDEDHQYAITAEVVDESRRTIVGTGNVLVARKPFSVFAWVDRGHYRAGDTVRASFDAHTLDNKPVEGKGTLTLFKLSYEKDEPVEKAAQTWDLDTNAEGRARQQLTAAEPGQYRLSYKVTDSKKHTVEGGYLFVVRGEGFDGHQFRFNDLELITDKREYAPGERVKLLVNTNRTDGTVLLFLRPTNGLYQPPKVIRLKGKSTEEDVGVVQRDMPNFFIEAVTVADGRVHTETREVVVPPEKRVLNVEVQPSQKEYRPGQKATVKVRLTDAAGKPFAGTTAVTVYDKSVEYVAGGSNVPEIREFFWKWRRHHNPQTESSLVGWSGNLLRTGEVGMNDLGVFGAGVAEEWGAHGANRRGGIPERMPTAGMAPGFGGMGGGAGAAPPMAAPMGGPGGPGFPPALGLVVQDRAKVAALSKDGMQVGEQAKPGEFAPAPGVEPTVRKNFADTAFWAATLSTDRDGTAEIALTMPENLTGWKVKVWAMGHGTKVGQGEAEVTTKKDLLVRLQAPRFFVQKDEVVLSANVHNSLKADKDVTATLEVDGGVLAIEGRPVQVVRVPANDERRVDWRVRVLAEGEAVVRVKAVTDEESDAMEMRYPSLVHGMLKTDSFSGVVRPDGDSARVTLTVPAERRINETRLEVRYSPTLAGAMVDALPYLVDYPYGCTEQTLNRFLPTVVTQRILRRMNLDLKAIETKRTNLNAQEIGDARERARGWKRFPRNPVFSEDEVKAMSEAGVQALAGMQCSDGGWGWFSGFGEHSWPHTTAVVVHGLQVARENNVAFPQAMLTRGLDWLQAYEVDQLVRLRNAPSKTQPYKVYADNLDALVYMVLADAGVGNAEMRDFLFRDRTHLAVYAKAMFGLALQKQSQLEKLGMILQNVEQYLVQDAENQTAYLKLPEADSWWCWYGSDVEANAYYLKLLSRTNPKDEKAAGLVKYLLNNRKHATYWNSTRDTAVCIEALAEYLTASGQDRPDMTVEVYLDGKKHKEVKIDAANLFTFDNQFVLFGDAVDTGKHVLEIKRKGTGPVYFNAYLTNFTLEDFITRAGLEVRVNRKYYKLTRADKTIKTSGSRGQALDQKVEKYERTELANLASLKSGDLVEVELEIDSKNDYEYLVFEDPKAAGFEAELVRSGYNPNDLGAYMELRDDRVCFFVRQLARGKHSVRYRLRAEIPGKFSALPTRAYAMYAPELKGNSDEIKLAIED
jgi:uncharacterized protein YfaS (alpha-2-macroglobulin family)